MSGLLSEALGLTAETGRKLSLGARYDHLFPTATGRTVGLKESGSLEDTLRLIPEIIRKYQGDTRRLAPLLEGQTLEATLRNLWQFVYRHIGYRRDEAGKEQLRRPARSWADRREGVDCDCYSIFLGSALANLGIPFTLRITQYGGRPQYQHIYVIVPDDKKSGKPYWTLDPVLDHFNHEKPFTGHRDIPMRIELLHGLSEELTELETLLGLEESPSEEQLRRHLQATQELLRQQPRLAGGAIHPENLNQMLGHALRHWDLPEREAQLERLAGIESELWERGELAGVQADLESYLEGLEGTWDLEESLSGYLSGDDELLGRRRKGGKGGFFRRIGRGVGKAAKGIGKAVVRFNPLTVSIRNGLLLALRLNVQQIGSKLKYGYLSEEEAGRRGMDLSEWRKLVSQKDRWEKRFEKLGGKRSNFKNAILKGKAGGLDGTLGELAYPIALLGERQGPEGWELGAAPAAGMAAAGPIIAAIAAALKEVDFQRLMGSQPSFETSSAQPTQEEPFFAEPEEALVEVPEDSLPESQETDTEVESIESSPVEGYLRGEDLEDDLGFAFLKKLVANKTQAPGAVRNGAAKRRIRKAVTRGPKTLSDKQRSGGLLPFAAGLVTRASQTQHTNSTTPTMAEPNTLPAVVSPPPTTQSVATSTPPKRNLFQRIGDWFRDPTVSTSKKLAAGAGSLLATGALVYGGMTLLGVDPGLSGLMGGKKTRRKKATTKAKTQPKAKAKTSKAAPKTKSRKKTTFSAIALK